MRRRKDGPMRRELLFAIVVAIILVGTMAVGITPAGVAGGKVTAANVGPVYDILEIPVTMPKDFATEGVSISRGGVLTGRILGTTYRAFTWTLSGGLVELPNYPSRPNYSIGYGVNDSGTVVGLGSLTYDFLFPLPLMWQNGEPSVLPFDRITMEIAAAYAVNASDVVVGSVGGGVNQIGMVFTGPNSGEIQPFPFPQNLRYKFTAAYSINDNGVVVGPGTDALLAERNVPFVYDIEEKTVYELPSLPVHDGGIPFAISNGGHIAGISQLGQRPPLPVVWDPDGQISAIPLPPDTFTGVARGVNSDGWVVGYAGGEYSVPFLYDGAATYRLQDLIPPHSGWDLSENVVASAMGISEDGMIVGTGMYHNKFRAYAMIPRRMHVAVRPGGCPNSINLKARGLLPVAILGSAEFDVGAVDAATIRLNGAAPLWWSYGDVAASFAVSSEELGCSSECVEGRPDGIADLMIQFSNQDLAAVLGDVGDGDCVKMTLTASLKDGSASIREDFMVIIKKKG